MEIFTSEGLYITKINTTKDLWISENDINLQKQNCFMMKNIINFISKNIKEYTSFIDNSGQELVLYNNNAEILIFYCLQIDFIWIK